MCSLHCENIAKYRTSEIHHLLFPLPPLPQTAVVLRRCDRNSRRTGKRVFFSRWIEIQTKTTTFDVFGFSSNLRVVKFPVLLRPSSLVWFAPLQFRQSSKETDSFRRQRLRSWRRKEEKRKEWTFHPQDWVGACRRYRRASSTFIQSSSLKGGRGSGWEDWKGSLQTFTNVLSVSSSSSSSTRYSFAYTRWREKLVKMMRNFFLIYLFRCCVQTWRKGLVAHLLIIRQGEKKINSLFFFTHLQ